MNEPEAGPGEIFTPEQLLDKWNEYAAQLKNKSTRMHITLKNRVPKLKEGFRVEIAMDNRAQEEEFNKEEKVSLTGFLRRELNNNKIEVLTVIEEDETKSKRVYTDADKLNFLIKKNPALQKLKNDLNLDFE